MFSAVGRPGCLIKEPAAVSAALDCLFVSECIPDVCME